MATQVDDGVPLILDDLARTLGHEKAVVVLLDPSLQTIEDALGANIAPPLLEALRSQSAKTPLLTEGLLLGRPVRVDDARTDRRISDVMRSFYVDAGMLAFVGVPLLPIPGMLLVSKEGPLTEADINDLFPYTSRLVMILQQRQEQQAWQQSHRQHATENDRLRRMLDSVTDPVIYADERNTILLQNNGAERLFGTSPTDGPGKRRAIELNNFLLSAALSSYVLDQGAAFARELTLVDPVEGSELLYEIICRPASSIRTGERGLVAVIKDVTGLRQAGEELRLSLRDAQRANEELRHERDRLKMILENVAEPIVVTSASNDIILMNAQAERLLSGPESRRERAAGFMANETKFTSLLLQFNLEAADTMQSDLQFIDPGSADSLTMTITATKVRDGVGQVIANVSVFHDLTQLRELERRRLAQELFDSEKLAAVGRLAAAISHEINNPLEAIKNAIYAVFPHLPEGSADQRLLGIAQKETERVSRIIRQMLGLYRVDTTKTSMDANLVMDEALVLLKGQLTRHRIKLSAELDRGLPSIPAVSDQIKQVFLNLLINAQEAMDKGGELRVATRLSGPGDADLVAGRYVLAEVQDTGPGIPEEYLHKIFDPFFSTKRERKGTGLGLWVSQDIVQRHGGQLKVRTRVGRGTTFTVALPIGGEDDRPETPAHS